MYIWVYLTFTTSRKIWKRDSHIDSTGICMYICTHSRRA